MVVVGWHFRTWFSPLGDSSGLFCCLCKLQFTVICRPSHNYSREGYLCILSLSPLLSCLTQMMTCLALCGQLLAAFVPEQQLQLVERVCVCVPALPVLSFSVVSFVLSFPRLSRTSDETRIAATQTSPLSASVRSAPNPLSSLEVPKELLWPTFEVSRVEGKIRPCLVLVSSSCFPRLGF